MHYVYLLLLFFPFLLMGCDESGRQKIESVASPSLVKSELGDEGTISKNPVSVSELTTGGAIGDSGAIATNSEGTAASSIEEMTNSEGLIFSSVTNSRATLVQLNYPVTVSVPEPTSGGLTVVGSSLVMLLILRRRFT
jgi:hypothetical protein